MRTAALPAVLHENDATTAITSYQVLYVLGSFYSLEARGSYCVAPAAAAAAAIGTGILAVQRPSIGKRAQNNTSTKQGSPDVLICCSKRPGTAPVPGGLLNTNSALILIIPPRRGRHPAIRPCCHILYQVSGMRLHGYSWGLALERRWRRIGRRNTHGPWKTFVQQRFRLGDNC